MAVNLSTGSVVGALVAGIAYVLTGQQHMADAASAPSEAPGDRAPLRSGDARPLRVDE